MFTTNSTRSSGFIAARCIGIIGSLALVTYIYMRLKVT